MTSGHHAAEDGSLARSTGGAAARGALLIALALVIGLLLVMFALNDPQTEIVASDTDAAADTADGDDAAAGVEGDAGGAAVGAAGAEDGADAPVVGTPEEEAATTETIPQITTDPEPGADDQPPEPTGQILPPNEVTVLVANGRGTAGVAGGVRDVLVADGYTTEVSNAPATASGVIFYRPGFDANAIAIGQALGAAPDAVLPAPDNIGVSSDAVSDGRLGNANVIVIIGADESVPPA